MNFVRHHSHILPIEYFDAACEVGIMVSAEFPIAYGKPKDCDSGGCDPLYKVEWASIIKQIRNHPCVFDYVRAAGAPHAQHARAACACSSVATFK